MYNIVYNISIKVNNDCNKVLLLIILNKRHLRLFNPGRDRNVKQGIKLEDALSQHKLSAYIIFLTLKILLSLHISCRREVSRNRTTICRNIKSVCKNFHIHFHGVYLNVPTFP